MADNFIMTFSKFQANMAEYLQDLYTNPMKIITLILDIVIVLFIVAKFIQIVKDSRAWQILKGIAFFIIATALSAIFNLHILNYILTSFMAYGVIAIIVIFQPELRRALEQLRNE